MAHHHRQAERQSPWTSCFDLVVFLPSLVQRGLPSTIFIVFLSSEVSTECAGPVLKVNILIIILTMDLDDLLLPSVLLKQGLSRVLWPGLTGVFYLATVTAEPSSHEVNEGCAN